MTKTLRFLSLTILLLALTFQGNAQSATATYTTGVISTDFSSFPATSTPSACSADLLVTVPAGQFVTGVDIEYDMTATGGAWLQEQISYVECVTTGTTEAAVTPGPPQSVGGTNSYSRTGLTFASGIVPGSGTMIFRLHAFRSWGGSGCNTGFQSVPNNTYKVTVYYAPPPTCPQPNTAAITTVTANSIDLSWVSGGATNWQVQYWPFSNPTNKTIVNVTTNPYSLTGLNPSTNYVIQVRDSCGLGDVSFWTSFQSVKTSCSTVPAPWTENFDSPDWVIGPFNSAGSIDTCFTRNWSNNMTWETGPPTFISSFTGPSADHTTGSGKFIFSDINGFLSVPDTALIVTPEIDLSPLTIPEFTFWYHMFGANVGSLKVQVSSNGGTTFTDVATINGQQQNSGTDPWKERIINLSTYANSNVIIRFIANQAAFGFQGDIAVDDLDIHEQPTCPKPTNLQVLAASFNQVTLGWTSGGATSWQIEYGSPGFTPGTGTLVSASSNPFVVSGLANSTTYEFIVRDSCGLNDLSPWSSSVSASTLCGVQSSPFFEDFEGSSFNRGPFNNSPGTIDICWNRDVSGSFIYKTGPAFFSFGSGSNVDHTLGTVSGKYLYSERILFSGAVDTTEVISPLVDLSALTNPQLTFWYHMFGGDIDKLLVSVSNDFGLTYSQVYVRNGQQQNSNVDVWKEALVDLSAFIGDTILVKFESVDNGSGFNSNVCIDDFNIGEQPTCPKPQDLAVVGATNTTITLGWTSGGASNWNIEYGSPGFAPGSGTIIAVTSNPVTITGLLPNTGYEFYVQDSCGLGDVSLWDGPVGDTTDCNPVSAPFLETFDGSTWVPGTFFSAGSIDQCWNRDVGQSYVWKPNTSNTTFNSGPTQDHTSGSGKFMNADRLFGGGVTPADRTFLTTPLIDLAPLTVPELSFWYHMFGADIDSLVVDLFDGTSWTTILSFQGAQQSAKSDPWKEAVIDLSAYANDTIKVRFTAIRTSTTSFSVATSLDDVDIHEQPSCPKPSNFSVVSSGANDVTISWTTGSAANWQIEYGPAGFNPGSGTVISVNTNPYTVTGLNSASTYDFYVRDSCSATDFSDWLGPVTGSTSCLPIAAPFTETFDGAQWAVGPGFNDTGSIANCWVRYPLQNYFWRPGPPPFVSNFTGPSGDHTSGNGGYLFSESTFSGGSPPFDAFVETPPIDLSPLTVPELSFWYHMYGAGIGSLEVQIDNGSGFTPLQTWTGNQHVSPTDPWKEAVISLSAYANDTVVIRFKANKASFNTSSDAAIDDVDIHEAPSCPKPFNLSSIATSNGFVVSWTTGGSSSWQIEYGPVGFVPGAGTLVNVLTNPFTISGLNSNTAYDLYVRDSCGVANVSAWLGPQTNTTLCSVFSTPFTENFDGATWIPGPFINDPGSIDQCWDRNATTGYYWKSSTGGTGSFNTGPSADHTTGSGKYMYTENFGGALDSAIFLSPSFDLSSLTNPEMRFWYHMYGANISKLDVSIFSNGVWTFLTTVAGQQQTAETDPWAEQIASLSTFLNDTVRFRFVAHRTSGGFISDIALDDFWLGEAPNCPRPVNLASTTQTTTSITINWTTGGAANWLVGYRPTGSLVPLTIIAAANNPFTITGLSPSTSYSIYVKDSCAAGDVSLWTGPLSISTLCGLVTAPWNESFDGGDWVPGAGALNFNNQISPCWSRPNPNNPNFGPNAGPTSSTSTGPSGAFGGTGKYIYSESSGGSSGSGQITSPFIYIPSSMVSPRLKFAYHLYGASITSFRVDIDDGSGFNNELTLTGQQQFSSNAPWEFDSINLSNYIGDTIRVRFLSTSFSFQADMAVDEITIFDPTQCVDPTGINFTNITSTSARINWSSPNPASDLEVVLLGQPQGTGDLYTGVTSPFDVTNLLPATNYVIYIRDSCVTSLYSNWIMDTLTTAPCPVINANFSFTTNILVAGFNSSGTTNADSVYWQFGDGTDTSFANPTHMYPGAGTYVVNLYAFNICDVDTMVDTVVVCDTLLANFSNTQVGDTVILDASSTQGGSQFYWDFGDGNDTTGVVAKHLYGSAGSKLVTLTVVNACGDTATAQKTIKICLPPVAEWTGNVVSSGANGMVVQFDATASQNASTYDWDFGDGNTATGVSQPLHTYAVPGLFYIVKLTITNDCGDVSTKTYRLNEIGLDDYDLSSQVKIYPNPAVDFLTIEWDAEQSGKADLRILSADGKLVYQRSLIKQDGNEFICDIRGFSKGVYSIVLLTDRGQLTQQLVIQ